MTRTVVSPDGSQIAFASYGDGPAMLLVHGGTATRRIRWAPVREKLAARYTVHEMDRRGRGGSTAEVGPYGLAREGQDVAAVAEALGGDVYVVGHSYGALCTIEAALVTSAFRRIVLYEPPMRSPGANVMPPELLASMKTMSDPGAILETFYLNALQLPQAAVDALKGTEVWQARLTAAPTIIREIEEVNKFRATDRLAGITAPVRMLLGTESPTYLRAATAAIAAQLPDARIVAAQGQAHQAIDNDPDQFVRLVFDFDAITGAPGGPVERRLWARRKRVKPPPSTTTTRSRASPAWAPSAGPLRASETGTQICVDAPYITRPTGLEIVLDYAATPARSGTA